MIIYEYMCTWIRYIFVRNYDFIYMIFEQIDYELILIPKPMGAIYCYSDTQPMGAIYWYSDTQTNGGRSLVFWYPNQWGSFIGTPIPKPMGVVHWYSDTQTNRGCSLVFWYPNQWGLFIGTLMPSHGDIAWP